MIIRTSTQDVRKFGEIGMILRRLVFAALRTAASNPEVRRQAAKLAERGLQSAKPGLLTASRKAGQAVRAASDELSDGVRKFKAGREGTDDEVIPSTDEAKARTGTKKKKTFRNISPRKG